MVNFKQLLGEFPQQYYTQTLHYMLPLTEKATSPAHSDPDWEAILEIVEEIKSKSVTYVDIL